MPNLSPSLRLSGNKSIKVFPFLLLYEAMTWSAKRHGQKESNESPADHINISHFNLPIRQLNRGHAIVVLDGRVSTGVE